MPPQLSNTVVVSGGTDAVVLTFYYVSSNTVARAFGGLSNWAHVERHGEVATIRNEPVARIALPFSVTLDVLADMVETLVRGAPDVQESVMGFMQRFTEVMKEAEAIGGMVSSAQKSGEEK